MKKLIVANWKENPGTGSGEARELFLRIVRAKSRVRVKAEAVEISVAPPFCISRRDCARCFGR